VSCRRPDHGESIIQTDEPTNVGKPNGKIRRTTPVALQFSDELTPE
jgi:hypothetical protein